MSKYFSRKVVRDGINFDSAKEAGRYMQLRLLERAGKITDLQTQVKFVLIPAQREPDVIGPRGGVTKGKLLEREVCYVADFVYRENGVQVVEDVKGYKGSTAYDMFVVKRKLMLYVHGIRVKEV